MCVANTLRGRARPVLFDQDEIYRVPSCAALNECTPPHCATVPGDKKLVKFRSKVCPKRRYHTLPPGKTAKHHDRQFVVHDYHDHSQDENDDVMVDRGCFSPSSAANTGAIALMHFQVLYSIKVNVVSASVESLRL
jgi:hypothetical protein